MSPFTTRCNRPRRLWRAPAAAALAVVFAFGASACKQSEGDVCQIDDDCEDGLECNAGTMRCQEPGGGVVVDSGPEPDAPVEEDAGPADAGVDAGTPDAAPDASTADAAL